MKKTSIDEKEVRLFWQISGELRQAVRDGQEQFLIDYHLDELEGLLINTDNLDLKRRASEMFHHYKPKLADTGG